RPARRHLRRSRGAGKRHHLDDRHRIRTGAGDSLRRVCRPAGLRGPEPERSIPMKRRTPRTVIGALAAILAATMGAAGGGSAKPVTVPATFDNPLPIPPLAESRLTSDGTRVFQLTAQPGSREFIAGTPSSTWGYNGDYLGPTLRAARGEKVAIEFRNRLPEA